MLEISQDNNRLQQYNAHKFKDIPSIFQSKLDMVLNFGKNQSLYPRIENPNEINDSIFNYSNSFNSDAEYQRECFLVFTISNHLRYIAELHKYLQQNKYYCYFIQINYISRKIAAYNQFFCCIKIK